MFKIKVEVCSAHAHLTQSDLEKLFGEGYKLEKEKDFPGFDMFLSSETVTLEGKSGKLENIPIYGPCRGYSQIEVSRTDSQRLGVEAPLRLSGKVIRSGAIKLIGPKGELELTEGLIVPKRHVHVEPEQAAGLNLRDKQNIKVHIDGPRALTFEEVEVRVEENAELVVHIDRDEANAAGVSTETEAELIV